MNEQNLNLYLQDLVNNNEILDYSLIGIDSNSAEAIIKRNIFGDVIEENVLIIPYLNTYKYSKITNRNKVDDSVESKVINLQQITNNIISLITETLPKNSVESYKNDKTDLILSIWKYVIQNHPSLIDPKIIDGFNNLTTPDENLNEEQKRNKWDLENWINKLNARHRIEVEVGDTLDQMTDVSKRLSMVERSLMRLFLHVTGDYEMISEIQDAYSSYMLPIVQAADQNIPIDRTDLENPQNIINELMYKNQKIIDIVKTEYLDKMK